MEKILFNAKEACCFLGISKSTLLRLSDANELKKDSGVRETSSLAQTGFRNLCSKLADYNLTKQIKVLQFLVWQQSA